MHKKCKECGQMLGGKTLDKALTDKSDIKLTDDDNDKLGLLDELQDSMGSGMDGAIKIIIESRGK